VDPAPPRTATLLAAEVLVGVRPATVLTRARAPGRPVKERKCGVREPWAGKQRDRPSNGPRNCHAAGNENSTCGRLTFALLDERVDSHRGVEDAGGVAVKRRGPQAGVIIAAGVAMESARSHSDVKAADRVADERVGSRRGVLGLMRRLALPAGVANWSLPSLQQRLVKPGGRLIKHARCYWLLLAESDPTRRLFGGMLAEDCDAAAASGIAACGAPQILMATYGGGRSVRGIDWTNGILGGCVGARR
jgi:hypothetical protein